MRCPNCGEQTLGMMDISELHLIRHQLEEISDMMRDYLKHLGVYRE